MHFFLNLYHFKVHRVSWLKARARYERWKEELQIVKREMLWTTLWFKHHEQKWERRYKTYPKPGLKAYAAKQKCYERTVSYRAALIPKV